MNDDFRTHCAPMPTPQMIDPTTHPFETSTEEPCLSYTVNTRNDTLRPPCALLTRGQTTILTGNVQSRPDYRTAARSGFTASEAPAPPPKVPLRLLPPPRTVHLGSTIPLGHFASLRRTPPPSNPQLEPFAASGALYYACHSVGPRYPRWSCPPLKYLVELQP